MQTLKQLVKLIKESRLRKIEILGDDNSESQTSILYRLIRDGKINSDEEAQDYFFKEAERANSLYRHLKSRFTEKIMNFIFFIEPDEKEFGEYTQNTVRLLRKAAVINIISRLQLVSIAVAKAEKLLPDLIKFHQTEIILDFLGLIKGHYATMYRDRKMYEHYNTLHKKYKEIYWLEMEAKEAFEYVRLEYGKMYGFHPEVAQTAEKYYKALEEGMKKYDSRVLHIFGNVVRCSIYSERNDYQGLLKVTDEALNFFLDKEYHDTLPLTLFSNQKTIACIQLRLYDEGQKNIEFSLARQKTGSYNWYRTLEHQMILALHTQRYDAAYVTYKQAINNEGFKRLQSNELAIWKLFEAYLYLVVRLKKVSPKTIQSQGKIKDLKTTKFMNEVHEFSFEKAGMNVPVLIIQNVLLIMQGGKDRQQLGERLEALKQYAHRNIAKGESGYRTNHFIKILLELYKTGFQLKPAKKRIEKLLEEMHENPLIVEQQNYQAEIIPFEYLWEMMEEVLEPENNCVPPPKIMQP